MRDGYYRITHKREQDVVKVERNRCYRGKVETLMNDGWTFEEVEPLTEKELKDATRN